MLVFDSRPVKCNRDASRVEIKVLNLLRDRDPSNIKCVECSKASFHE